MEQGKGEGRNGRIGEERGGDGGDRVRRGDRRGKGGVGKKYHQRFPRGPSTHGYMIFFCS